MGPTRTWTPIAPFVRAEQLTPVVPTTTTLPSGTSPTAQSPLRLFQGRPEGWGSWCWASADVALVATVHVYGLVMANVDINGVTISITHSVTRPKDDKIQRIVARLVQQSVPQLDGKETERLIGDLYGVERHSHTLTTFNLPFVVNGVNVISTCEDDFKYFLLTRAVPTARV